MDDDVGGVLLFAAFGMLLMVWVRKKSLARSKTAAQALSRPRPAGIFALVVVAGLAGFGLVPEKPGTSASLKTASPVVATTSRIAADKPMAVLIGASRTSRLYESNESAATEHEEGGSLRISGTVQSTDKDVVARTTVGLHPGDRFTAVHATLDDEHASLAANLKSGQRITLTCTSGAVVVGSLLLRRCAPA